MAVAAAPDARRAGRLVPCAAGDRLMAAADPLTIEAIRTAIASGAATATSVCEAALERIGARDTRLGAFLAVAADAARAPRSIARRPAAWRSRSAPWRADRAQGQHVHARACDDRRVADPRALRPAVRRDRRRAARSGRRGRRRQDQSATSSRWARRPRTARSARAQSLGDRRAPGGSSGGIAVAVAARHDAGRARLRHRRVDSAARRALRRRRRQADLRSRLALRAGRVRLVARSGRAARAHGRRRRAGADGDRGPDPHDATASPQPVADYVGRLDRDVAGCASASPRVFRRGRGSRRASRRSTSASTRSRARAPRWSVDLPHARYAIPVYYLVATAEASQPRPLRRRALRPRVAPERGSSAGRCTAHPRRGFRRRGQAPHHARHVRAQRGYYDAYYLKAQQVRTLIRRDYEQAFDACDVVAMPTTPRACVPTWARRPTTRCRCISNGAPRHPE